jgi:hypothetical protein
MVRSMGLTRLLVALLATSTLVLSGCAGGRPAGPLFEWLAPPDPMSTLVYIYRSDVQRGVAPSPIRLNGDEIATLKNGEYVALVVNPGPHEIRGAILWLWLIARSWNQTSFEAKGGTTLYVKLWAATAEVPAIPASAEAPGRSDRKADVGLFMGRVDREVAEAELPRMRRANFR